MIWSFFKNLKLKSYEPKKIYGPLMMAHYQHVIIRIIKSLVDWTCWKHKTSFLKT